MIAQSPNGDEDLASYAGQCLRAIEEMYSRVRAIKAASEPRTVVAMALAVVAIVHAKSSVLLIRSVGEQSVTTARALQRVMIEALLRSAFFGRAASDAEVQRFVEKGKLPNREEGPLTLRGMARECEVAWGTDLFCRALGDGDELSRLHGLTHSGMEIIQTVFRDGKMGPYGDKYELAGLANHGVAIAGTAAEIAHHFGTNEQLEQLRRFAESDAQERQTDWLIFCAK